MKRYKYTSSLSSSFFNSFNRGYDSNKTVSGDKVSSLFSDILSDFPEYNAPGYSAEVTNIGIIVFTKNSSNIIVYDLLDKDDTTELDNINPDNSILEKYTYINNPFNYRIINLKNGSFVPDREIVNGSSKYVRINADYIFVKNNSSQINPDNDTGWFSLPSDAVISKVCYYYKPAFRLSGNAITEPSTVTNYKNTNDFIISSSLDSYSFGWNCSNKTGYLEVR